MKTESEIPCCSPRAAAVALVRWCIGLMFLFAGVGKLPNVSGFAQHLAQQFEKTWLPPFLVGPFGHVLPFLEVTVGALLVLGVFRDVVLFITGLLLLALTFGQIVLGQPQVVFFNTGYVFITATLLFLSPCDQWVLFPRPPAPISAPARECHGGERSS